MLNIPHIGEILSLATALVWAIAVILFKQSGMSIGPLHLNLFKNLIGLFLLFATLLVLKEPLIFAEQWKQHLLIIVSGAIGIGLSDTLFFASLNRLGASGIAVVECFYSPFVVLFSYFLLGEVLSLLDAVGGVLILISIVLPSLNRDKKTVTVSSWYSGVVFGILAMFFMAGAIVVIKPLLNLYSSIWVAAWRMAGGVVALLLYVLFSKNRFEFFYVFSVKNMWKKAVPASILGSYISLMLWIAGFKYTQATTAALLNQTSIVFLIAFAALFLKERITITKVFSIILALIGSVFVLI